MAKSNAISRAKKTFFSSKEVQSMVDKETRQVFSKFGAHVRQRARQSIRKRKTAAPPGRPPSSHSGKLKRFIFFGYDKAKRSVVIGPVRLTGKNKGDAPELLEYGGVQVSGPNPRRQDRHKGESGVISIGKHDAARSAYEARERTRRNPKPIPYKQVVNWRGKKVWVAFGKLFTDEQVRHSEELETLLWGPKKLGGKVEARPFMWAAAREEIKSLPDKWRNSIK
ncbi:MAG: hypothetical protein PHQ75_01445 [Thermoguttaceae bacterium]|nr:hypothetical protein [Thermoguttaceae bacterium]